MAFPAENDTVGSSPSSHVARLSPLCTTCSQLFIGHRQDQDRAHRDVMYPIDQAFLALEDSGRDRCHLCFLRWQQLSSEERAQLQSCSRIEYAFTPTQLVFRYHYSNPLDAEKE